MLFFSKKKKNKHHKKPKKVKFNSFNGVFVPTFLSIIGVILFLRLGYIVGSGGLFSAIAIILLASSVTFATGLSLSSIVTTLRIGAGGAYSVISKTLGLEVGGSVGIPLVLAQIFSVVFYIFGFAEAWNFIFPEHSQILVGLLVLIVLLALTFIKVDLAIKAQMLVFILIASSVVSLFVSGESWWENTPNMIENFALQTDSFWALFALFFPAVTGIMAGTGLSGDLSDPKKQIPRGLLTAIVSSIFIYIGIAIWLSSVANSEELINNSMALVDNSIFPPLILAGIISATFSSALTTFVAAPRLLQALGENKVIIFNNFFAKLNKKSEPGNAMIFSFLIILIALLLGNLDSIAPLLTMFFLLTYAVINIAVYTELTLGLVSFRPTFRVPKFIPLFGFLASIIFMFLINPIAGLIAVAFLVGVYIFLVFKNLEPKEGDVRSGLFTAIAEWAAKTVEKLPESTKHTWKPNILVPVILTRTLLGNFPLIKSIAYPNGTMTVLGLDLKKNESAPDAQDLTKKEITDDLAELGYVVEKFGKEGLFASSSVVDCYDYTEGVIVSMEAISSQVFHPNILFLPFKPDKLPKASLRKIFKAAEKFKVGVMLFDRDEDIGLGSERDIHVWIPDKALDKEFYDDRTFDLAMLSAYQISKNWRGNIHLWTCTTPSKKDQVAYYLRKLRYEARLPSDSEVHVSTKSFQDTLKKAPHSDIHIVSVSTNKVETITALSKKQNKSFLFVADSSDEDILA
ncbi:hypothetical protein GF376_00020 [Candidatus Peregrinibacteria bacterium]|nr:hypothetical protein [Candidatus Peregrinibacteria bacterium]